MPNIKRTYEEMISFIAKKVENMLRSNFEDSIFTLSFVSSGVEYCSRKDFITLLLANSMGKINFSSFLHLMLENICGSPISYGVSSGSAKGLGGQKERDDGPPPALFTLRTELGY